MRATTTAVTIASSGRRCLPVPSPAAAHALAAGLEYPLLVGEFGGELPDGFDVQNSPTAMESRNDLDRPAVLLSSSGTRLLHEAGSAGTVFASCLRNVSAQVAYLVAHHPQVAVIGAGTKGEFRSEDQFGCARIAAGLLDAGYDPVDAAPTCRPERGKTPTGQRPGTPVTEVPRSLKAKPYEPPTRHGCAGASYQPG